MKNSQVITVRGGYHVTLNGRPHFVNKQRRCSCHNQHCQAIKAVTDYLRAGGQRAPEATATTPPNTFSCPVCSEPARGSLENQDWCCTVDRYHFWVWRVDRLRVARAEALKQASPYTLEVLSAFASDQTRATFLAAHTLTYPAAA